MNHTGGFCLWGAIALAVAGCGGEPAVRPNSAAPSVAKAAASSPSEARVRYQLYTTGLPLDGRWKSTPVLADVNKDGFLDLGVHPRLEQGARVWLGNGKGAWTDSSRGLEMDNSCGGGLQFGDFNKDGNLDLVVADHCDGVSVYLGDGKGGWQRVAKLKSAMAVKMAAEDPDTNSLIGTEAVAIGDVNGDGILDIVTAASDQGGFTLYLGDGTGRNWTEVRDSGLPSAEHPEPGGADPGGWARDVHLVDMNGDGRLDVVASYYSGPRVWRGDGKGHFEGHSKGLTTTSLGGVYAKVAVADINGDGRLDLAVANGINGAEMYLQNADGSWQGPIDMMPALKGGAQAIALGDLDGDGNVDVVIGGELLAVPNPDAFGLYVRFGDGKGGFVDARDTNLPAKAAQVVWGIKVVDVNGDGRLDIVAGTGGAMGTAERSAGSPPSQAERAAARGESPKKDGGKPQDDAKGGTPARVPTLQVWVNEWTRGR